MGRPTFSIVTATLNEGARLRGAIESVLSQQECGRIQHIVVDGGSTDETCDILAEYPHLTVVRTSFVSSSQALNAGFAAAEGEIISWLNPRDRYASGAFSHVAEQIKRHPVVLGACGICDDSGNVLEQVENVERSWFDTMKYWVSHAVPMQPAVFFKRSVLSELEIDPGEVFDDGLYLSMDFDLWLRIQEYYPFSLRIPEVLAFRPQSEIARSVSDVEALNSEMSRVFRRHASRRVQPEQNFSLVVPVSNSLDSLPPLLADMQTQTLPSCEVVVVDHSGSAAMNRLMSESVLELGAKHRGIALRYVALPFDAGRSVAAAFDAGVRAARSHVVACLATPQRLSQTFVVDSLRCFTRDEIGLVLPSLSDELVSKLFTTMHGTRMFNPAGAFTLSPDTRIDYLVRKLAWLDSGGFSLHDRFPDLEFSVKRLMVMLAHKAWRVVSEPLVESIPVNASKLVEPFRLYENCVVVDELAREMRRDPFSIMRSRRGFGLVLPEDLWQCARGILEHMPQDANQSLSALPSENLRELCDAYPSYGPALFWLAEALEREGRAREAEEVRTQWRDVHVNERASPLYGGGSREPLSSADSGAPHPA